MLASNGSVASQGGGFKGVIFDNGVKNALATYTGAGSVSAYDGKQCIRSTLVFDEINTYGLTVSALAIKTNQIKFSIASPTAGANSYVRVGYTDLTVLNQIVSVGQTLTDYTLNVDSGKTISYITGFAWHDGSGVLYNTAIAKIEIL